MYLEKDSNTDGLPLVYRRNHERGSDIWGCQSDFCPSMWTETVFRMVTGQLCYSPTTPGDTEIPPDFPPNEVSHRHIKVSKPCPLRTKLVMWLRTWWLPPSLWFRSLADFPTLGLPAVGGPPAGDRGYLWGISSSPEAPGNMRELAKMWFCCCQFCPDCSPTSSLSPSFSKAQRLVW